MISILYCLPFVSLIRLNHGTELECPSGSTLIGGVNDQNDIAGCGLEGCDARYQNNYVTIEDCEAGCLSTLDCVSYTWTPESGDQNHPGKTVCTLYASVVPDQEWGPQQIMCKALQCAFHSSLIGGVDDENDIGGCGLEGCDARYQDNYESIEECETGCLSSNDCVSYSWTPEDGDKNHDGKTVCTLYNSDVPNQQWGPQQIMCKPNLECPQGSTLIGGIYDENDIAGCGLEGCDARYQSNYGSIEECDTGCLSNSDCVSYTWTPINGDVNHDGKSVCTLYDSDVPNREWGPAQVMCKPSLECGSGSILIGGINDFNDIAGCGLESCDVRYQGNYESIEDCETECKSRTDCASYSWTPTSGDQNHLGKTVCTLYDSEEPNQHWGPAQIMCKPSN